MDELAPERVVSTPPRSPLRAPIRLSFGDRASRGTFSLAPEGPILAANADPSVQQSVLLLQKYVRMHGAHAAAIAPLADLRVLATDRAAFLRPFQPQLPSDSPLPRNTCNSDAKH